MTQGTLYEGDSRRCVAMPLGGIGTGHVALGGTGVLKQWQLQNVGNHLGFLPQTFFGLRLSSVEPPLSIRRILQSAPPGPADSPAPLVNDHQDAPGSYVPRFGWPLIRNTRFEGAYPFARIDYEDDWPARVRLEAYNPLVPLDEESSGLPLVSMRFTVTNDFTHDLTGWLIGSLQNVVGWDGATPIRDASCAVLGGNVNTVTAVADGTGIVMSNPELPKDDRGSGSLILWTSSPAVALPQFDDCETALTFADSLKLLAPTVLDDWTAQSVARAVAALNPPLRSPRRPSAPGCTWAGCLAVPFHIRPGQTAAVEMVIAWHFPNRYADFDQFGRESDTPRTAPWIGNHYTEVFPDAQSVVLHYAQHREALRSASSRWADAVFASSLPAAVRDTLGAQPALIRSPTTFRAATGQFFGFEGVLGESSVNWNGNIGGSCPLNCTHVWNYEQAVSRIFPALERSMRETDWEVLQAPEGYLPHRVLFPLADQRFGRIIGGPDRPALDGMLGTVLKTYREARQGASRAWLGKYLPNMRKLMDYVSRTWDPEQSGLLRGDQPVTHDISLQGVNMYVGGIWLAALRAMQSILGALGHDCEAAEYGRRFTASSAAYDGLLWNGEFYGQSSVGDAFDFGSGCLADQLFGQWWAHQLDLGYLLPVDHVRTALTSIIRYNLRDGFQDFRHGYRSFADAADSGLLICTWPHGGRPQVPIRYADEVWSGVEYQVAGHLAYEGFRDESIRLIAAIRARHDGRRRNPYNEIENGDHYSRAMAGWVLLEAFTRSSYDALAGRLCLGDGFSRYPVLAATGWADVRASDDGIEVRCLGGTITVGLLTVTDADGRPRTAAVREVSAGGRTIPSRLDDDGRTLAIAHPVTLTDGDVLSIALSPFAREAPKVAR
jgi:non-lysosomal glucosylceramidase